MILSNDERLAILDEIISATERPTRKAYQFTRREFAERKGVTLSMAMGFLERGVAEGTLRRERLYVDGKRAWVYWRPEDERESQASRE